MATLDWHHTRTDGVTLVELLVTSETTTDVRIESTLTPVWPPKRQGVPAAGWDDHRFEGTVESGERLVVGYASPAKPDGPPARIETEPTEQDDDVDAETLVRALGEAKPPRDLVPVPVREMDQSGSTQERKSGTEMVGDAGRQANGETIAGPGQQPETTAGNHPQQSGTSGSRPKSNPSTQTGNCQPPTHSAAGGAAHTGEQSTPGPEASPPPALASWISAVEQRLSDAKRLAAVESPDEATAAVSSVGGIEEVYELQTQLAADREQLDQLSELSDRLESVEIPTEVLDRVT